MKASNWTPNEAKAYPIAASKAGHEMPSASSAAPALPFKRSPKSVGALEGTAVAMFVMWYCSLFSLMCRLPLRSR